MTSETTTKRQIDIDAEHMAFFYELAHDADKSLIITRGLQDVVFNLTLTEYAEYIKNRVIPMQITTSKAYEMFMSVHSAEKILDNKHVLKYCFIWDTAVAIYKDASVTSECNLLPSNICWMLTDQSEEVDTSNYEACRGHYVDDMEKCDAGLNIIKSYGYIDPLDTFAETSGAVYTADVLIASAFSGVHWNKRNS